MGALALTFPNAPIMGIDLARTQMTRAQTSDLASNLMQANVSPYSDPGMNPGE